MVQNSIGSVIMRQRKLLGYTQQDIADRLNVSFQAVSKWENGQSMPDIMLLPRLAQLLNISVDALVGYKHAPNTEYEEKYKENGYYWGVVPNKLCYEIMKLRPPTKPYRVLDIGCGEGKDAVFLAKNGYLVTAFDASNAGIEKARALARHNGVEVNFFRADINNYVPESEFDIVYSSGVFHYLAKSQRNHFFEQIKASTADNGINVVNVFVEKPFIGTPPDYEISEINSDPWFSGELAYCYHDWFFHKNDEIIFECNSGGIPHKHCMNILIAEKPKESSI